MTGQVVAQERTGDGFSHGRWCTPGAALRAGAEKLGLSGEIGTGGIAAEVNGQAANLIQSDIVQIKKACQWRGDRQAKLGKIFRVNIGLSVVKFKKEEEWEFFPVQVKVEKIWNEIGAIGQINSIGAQFLIYFGSGDLPVFIDIKRCIAGIGLGSIVLGKNGGRFCPIDMIGRNERNAEVR